MGDNTAMVKAKTKTGRPTKITLAVVQKLEDAFKSGFSVTSACYLSGISRTTYYEHLEKDDDFTDRMTYSHEWLIAEAKQVIAKAIKGGDLTTAKWFLERKAADEFSPERNKKPEPEEDIFSKYSKEKLEAIIYGKEYIPVGGRLD